MAEGIKNKVEISTQKIAEALANVSAEKLQGVKSAEELQALLAEQGEKVPLAELQALAGAQGAGKAELTEEALENVAGGAWWEYLIPGYNLYAAGRDIAKAIKGAGSSPAPPPTQTTAPQSPAPAGVPASSGGGCNQDNSGNSGGQQNTQTGDNVLNGGMKIG